MTGLDATFDKKVEFFYTEGRRDPVNTTPSTVPFILFTGIVISPSLRRREYSFLHREG
jgi:hypothetical protein